MFRGRNTRSPSPGRAAQRPSSRARSRSTIRNSSMKTHDDSGNMIDHEPIDSFISDLEAIPTDEWRARTLAFESLVSLLPETLPQNTGNGITPWYRSATALRRLNTPISALILDARSTVAKHTCQHVAFLVQRTAALAPPNADICKYLLKDLLPSILGLHAQTVKTIRVYAYDMMAVVIPTCRFKSGLPVLLERLRKDKSRDVREGCVQYLRMILRHWTKDSYYNPQSDQSAVSTLSSTSASRKREDYLTKSICMHIGNGIARALMDSAQSVRQEAHNAFDLFRLRYPDLWNQIVQKQDGILSKDARLRKRIMNAAIKADAQGARNIDDVNGGSFEDDYDGVSVVSGGSRNSVNSWNSVGSFASKNSTLNTVNLKFNKRPMSTGRTRRPGFGGGAVRAPLGNAQKKLPPSGKRDTTSPTSPPPPLAQCTTTPQLNLNVNKENDPASTNEPATIGTGPYNNNNNDNNNNKSIDSQNTPPALKDVVVLEPAPDVVPVESNDTTVTPSPPMSQNHQLLAPRRSSMLLQERLKGAEQARDVGNGASGENGESSEGEAREASSNENLQVAMQLLQAHKSYIDELMENLRLEMNVVRDFEAVVTKAKRQKEEGLEGEGGNGIKPSEDDVLGYFETVYGFLDKGAENGLKLRQAMDKVSRAEYQMF